MDWTSVQNPETKDTMLLVNYFSWGSPGQGSQLWDQMPTRRQFEGLEVVHCNENIVASWAWG